jgi:hypothetical protein
LGIWKWWRKGVQKSVDNPDPKNITLPETKGEITLESIKSNLKDIDDVVYKQIYVNEEPVLMIYMQSMVDKSVLQRLVLDPLTVNAGETPQKIWKNAESVQKNELPSLLYDITDGYTVLLFTQNNLILKISTFSAPSRGVTTSESESTVLGPQDSFTESLNTNISLIKRRINNHNLKVKTLIVGTESRNKVAVLYMDNIANKQNVDRVIYRVNNIEYHGFFGLAVLKQMLEDKPYSPFPQFGISVRPDNVASALLDGRIIVILDDSPEAAIAPYSFLETFNSPEDFYNRWTTASLLRLIRFGGLFVSILLTSTYVSVLTFHPEMLPPALQTILSESRTRVPFPPVIEVMIIELVIEILREAGARMPTKIGQTIGIVGGIVIGTAAVEAGLASNIIIVLVAVSALLSFLPSNFLMSNAIRFVRYVFIIAAGWLGMYGQMLALAWLFAHLLNMTSLGTPYMTPGIPRSWSDLSNSVIRAPINFIMKRQGISRARKELIRPLDEE